MQTLVTRFLRFLPPEAGHALAHLLLRNTDVARALPEMPDTRRLSCNIAGIPLCHPIGLAAGFDKNGRSIHGLAKLGFSFVEVGTVTPLPQPGNSKPRVFRDFGQQILINRMGFNSQGSIVVANNLRRQRPYPVPVGVNIGPNRGSRDVIGDFCHGWETLADLADYVTVNVSSPNTPGLRSWLRPSALEKLLSALSRLRDKAKRDIPLFVKLSPDRLFHHDKARYEIFERHRVSGVILSNSSRWRPANLPAHLRGEKGGLSGRSLYEKTVQQITRFEELNRSNIPLIACGGIDDAVRLGSVLEAGAQAVQVYSGLIFQGPRVVYDMISLLMQGSGYRDNTAQ